MGLETGTYVDNLVTENPTGTDPKSQGDNHLRLIKTTLKNTFPNAIKPFRFPNSIAAKTTDYTVVSPTDDNKIIPVSSAAGIVTITLPTSDVADGFQVTILKSESSTNNVVVDGDSSTISGVASVALTKQYQYVTVRWVDTLSQWILVERLSEFPSGTEMLFRQTTPPVGWTKSTDYNEHLMRVVSGTVSSGGTLDFSDVFATYVTEEHVLLLDEIPAHDHGGGNHNHSYPNANNSVGREGGENGTAGLNGGTTGNSGTIIDEEGGGLGHEHSIELGVKYVDIIIAVKD